MTSPTAPRRPSLARRVLRWAPLALLAVPAVLFGGFLAMGGPYTLGGWFGLLYLTPPLAVIVLVGTLVYAAWKRRWRSTAVVATLVGSSVVAAPLAVAVGLVPLRYPASLDDTGPSATVRLPADGPIRVAWGGDRLETNNHAAKPDQRWAYDLFMEPYVVGTERLEDYGCYGVPVLAPAAGTVTVAHDGKPDAVPARAPSTPLAPLGNHVALRLDATETYLVLAHLAPGSVAVEVGDRVAEGDTLGACGNSGNTSEPHIHIHHQRQDPADVPVGFAEGLPLYFRDHDGPPMPEGGSAEQGGQVVATGATVRHVGAD